MSISTTTSIVGNLTRDPELHFSKGSGIATVNLSVAVNKSKKNPDGEWVKETHYFDCVAFGETAENAASSFTKGNRVVVVGYLQQRTWEDKDTGAKRSKVEVVIDEIAASVKWATVVVTKNEFNPENSSGNQRQDNFNQFSEEPF
jgi:single-strand DNA-binding protein